MEDFCNQIVEVYVWDLGKVIRRNSLGLDYKNLLSPNYDDEKPSILIVSGTGKRGVQTILKLGLAIVPELILKMYYQLDSRQNCP